MCTVELLLEDERAPETYHEYTHTNGVPRITPNLDSLEGFVQLYILFVLYILVDDNSLLGLVPHQYLPLTSCPLEYLLPSYQHCQTRPHHSRHAQ